LVYIAQKKIDSAKILTKESLKIGKKNKNPLSISMGYNRLAMIAMEEKDYEKSKKYYDSSYHTAIKAQNSRVVANVQQQLALIAIKTKNYKEAEKLLAKSREEFRTRTNETSRS